MHAMLADLILCRAQLEVCPRGMIVDRTFRFNQPERERLQHVGLSARSIEEFSPSFRIWNKDFLTIW